MPEIITKYPDIVLEVLRSSGAECGMGSVQHILTACPHERFCSLPSGEICVYGIREIASMTQVSYIELTGMALLVVFLAGVGLGMLWRRIR